jgi:general stress protein YciG
MAAADNQDNSQDGGQSARHVGRGFASMDPERQREIASHGGRAAHERGTAHEFTTEEARQAGSKGGKVAHQRGTAHEFDSDEARAAGRKGGEVSGAHRGAHALGETGAAPLDDQGDDSGR